MLPTRYATEQEPMLGEDDLVNPFSLNYASLAGREVPTSQAYTIPSFQSHVSPTVLFSRFLHFTTFLNLPVSTQAFPACVSLINVPNWAQKLWSARFCRYR